MMMMKFHKLALRTGLMGLALGLAGGANAAILYSFDGTIIDPAQTGDVIRNIQWSYVTSDFITADRTVQPSELSSCVAVKFIGSAAAGGVGCAQQNFAFAGSLGNFINFRIADSAESLGFVTGFIATPGNAFSQFGQYRDSHSTNTGRTTFGQLTVSLAPEVPEPATWAMMLIGFGAIGGAMRARRRVSVSYG